MIYDLNEMFRILDEKLKVLDFSKHDIGTVMLQKSYNTRERIEIVFFSSERKLECICLVMARLGYDFTTPNRIFNGLVALLDSNDLSYSKIKEFDLAQRKEDTYVAA